MNETMLLKRIVEIEQQLSYNRANNIKVDVMSLKVELLQARKMIFHEVVGKLTEPKFKL